MRRRLWAFDLDGANAEEVRQRARRSLAVGAALGVPGAAVLVASRRVHVPQAAIYVAGAAAAFGFLYFARGVEHVWFGPPSAATSEALARVAFGALWKLAFVGVIGAILAAMGFGHF